MNWTVTSCLALLISVSACAQKQSFDLATYTPPKGWKKQNADAAVQFSKEDAAKGSYCLITLYKSTPGTPDPKENFNMAWATLVKELVTVSGSPEMQPAATANGWEVQSGYSPFESDGNKGIALLVTASGFAKMVNMIILTNTDIYEKETSAFLESISLKKLQTETIKPKTTAEIPASSINNAAILGTWIKSGGINPAYGNAAATGNAGYTKDQYTFNSNGTYSFVSKTFRYSYNSLILVKENGTYQINGTSLLIKPSKSVIQSWSKKNGTDKFGALLTSQNRSLENITYQFTRHYFSGIQVWNLVLQASSPTQRDGPFSNNTTFSNAWYYAPVSANNTAIDNP
ncbi:MAG: hypothetical protein IPL84_17040 [Chitinophagaceae bacterium]|nr:hypothetical protein [Chitinophagaceae bacterium]